MPTITRKLGTGPIGTPDLAALARRVQRIELALNRPATILAFSAVTDEADASSGGSGSGTFVRQVPSGTVNGSNPTFTLTFAPSPADSLQLFKDGLLQKEGAGNDFTLSGLTITFLAGNIPQTGDNLYAIYASSAGPFTYEVPTGTVNGVNLVFTLSAAPNPANSLQLYKDGMFQTAGAGVDYTLATNTITFEAGNAPQTGDNLFAVYQP